MDKGGLLTGVPRLDGNLDVPCQGQRMLEAHSNARLRGEEKGSASTRERHEVECCPGDEDLKPFSRRKKGEQVPFCR